MNIFNKKKIQQKIIIVFILLILFNCIIPTNIVKALTVPFTSTWWEEAKEGAGDFVNSAISDFLLFLPKGIISVAQEFILGEEAFKENYPNIILSPGLIFSNGVPLLDANFINPKDEYTLPGVTDSYTSEGSIASKVSTTIANWFKALRYIAIIGLLIVLVYIGIKILLSTTSDKKAKYKQMLTDWLVALILVIFMQLIMAFIVTVTDEVTKMLSNTTINYQVYDDGTNTYICDNNMFIALEQAYNAEELSDRFGYTLMFFALVVFTLMFIFQYFKRLFYIAFYTLISPLVALTYPLDKMKDGQAQAFNLWLKEYIYNYLLQPFHLLIYSVLIGMAQDLAQDNMVYGLAVLGFMIAAEKLLKKMFGFDKATASGDVNGSFATGAALASVASRMYNGAKGKGGKSSGGGNSQHNSNESNIRFNPTENKTKQLKGFKNNSSESKGTAPQLEDKAANSGFDSSKSGADAGDNSKISNSYNISAGEQSKGKNIPDTEGPTPGLIGTEDYNKKEKNKQDTGVDTGKQLSESKNKFDTKIPINGPKKLNDKKYKDSVKQGNKKGKLSNLKNTVKKSRIGRIAGNAGRMAKRGIINGYKKGYVGKTMRFTGKVLGAAMGAGLGASIGLVSGIVKGDLNEGIKAVGTGIVTGGVAGGAIGGGIAGGVAKIPQAVIGAKGKLGDIKEGLLNGEDAERKHRNERIHKQAQKQYLNDPKNREMAERLKDKYFADDSNMSTDKILQKTMKYAENGITDEKDVERGLRLEKSGEFTQDEAMSAVQFADAAMKDRLLTEEGYNNVEASVKQLVGEENTEKAMKAISKASGVNYEQLQERKAEKIQRAERARLHEEKVKKEKIQREQMREKREQQQDEINKLLLEHLKSQATENRTKTPNSLAEKKAKGATRQSTNKGKRTSARVANRGTTSTTTSQRKKKK